MESHSEYFYSLLLLFLVVDDAYGSPDNQSQQAVRQPECPTWFYYNTTSLGCVCGHSLDGVVVCDQNSNTSMLSFQYCMTYVLDKHSDFVNTTVVMRCPYQYHKAHNQGLYVQLPQDVSDLNEFMCGGLNRTGLLCSDCEAGLGPAVFSYTLPCLKCLDSGYGWLLYMFLATFPTTVMFLVIIIFQVRVTSAPMNMIIFTCQVIVNAVNANPYLYTNVSKPGYHFTMLLLTVYGIWNLDFFRFVTPPFCISDTMTSDQALSLEYIVALYPLLLIVITYVCIQLHAKGCRILVYLWKPFQRCCCSCIPRRWNPMESLVHAFVAFILLSYSKIMFVSFTLLHYEEVFYMFGTTSLSSAYYNASVLYFGFDKTDHLPFGILAFTILVICSGLPVLFLLLYPTRILQKCLGCCSISCQLALRAFADTFQSHYKDGTTGTPDWRYFSGLYLLFRIFVAGTHVFSNYECYRIFCYGSAAMLFGLLRPYKENWINFWDSIAFALLSLRELLTLYDVFTVKSLSRFGYVYGIHGLMAVPLVYLTVFCTYTLTTQLGLHRRCILCYRGLLMITKGHRSLQGVEICSVSSEEGEPLLSSASGP